MGPILASVSVNQLCFRTASDPTGSEIHLKLERTSGRNFMWLLCVFSQVFAWGKKGHDCCTWKRYLSARVILFTTSCRPPPQITQLCWRCGRWPLRCSVLSQKHVVLISAFTCAAFFGGGRGLTFTFKFHIQLYS